MNGQHKRSFCGEGKIGKKGLSARDRISSTKGKKKKVTSAN